MGGVTHPNSVIFSMNYSSNSGMPTTFAQFASFNLNNNYGWLTGQFGRVDGSRALGANVNIYGDNRLLQSFELGATDFPVPVSLFVEGIRMIRIEVEHTMIGWPNVLTGDVAFAFTGIVE